MYLCKLIVAPNVPRYSINYVSLFLLISFSLFNSSSILSHLYNAQIVIPWLTLWRDSISLVIDGLHLEVWKLASSPLIRIPILVLILIFHSHSHSYSLNTFPFSLLFTLFPIISRSWKLTTTLILIWRHPKGSLIAHRHHLLLLLPLPLLRPRSEQVMKKKRKRQIRRKRARALAQQNTRWWWGCSFWIVWISV